MKNSITVKSFCLIVLFNVVACGGGSSSSTEDEPNNSGPGGNLSTEYTKAMLVRDLADQLSAAYDETLEQFVLLQNSAADYCLEPENANLFELVKQQWLAASASWQQVQGINFGPADEQDRRFKIAIYPNDSERLDSRIATLIAGDDGLSQIDLAIRSADLQGLTALERLFFQEQAHTLFMLPDSLERNCAYVRGVTENLQVMMLDIASQWSTQGVYYQDFIAPDAVESSLEDWVGSFVEHLEIIRDRKLRQVAMGNTDFIESPLAQQSLVNIEQNFALLSLGFDGEDGKGFAELLRVNALTDIADSFSLRITSALNALQATQSSLVVLRQSDSGISEIEALADSTHQVLESFAVDLAEALDIFVGFNGSDGD